MHFSASGAPQGELHQTLRYRYDEQRKRGVHTLGRRLMSFSENPHPVDPARRLAAEAFSFETAWNKSGVTTLAKLYLLAYPGAKPAVPTGTKYLYAEYVLAELYANDETIARSLALWTTRFRQDVA